MKEKFANLKKDVIMIFGKKNTLVFNEDAISKRAGSVVHRDDGSEINIISQNGRLYIERGADKSNSFFSGERFAKTLAVMAAAGAVLGTGGLALAAPALGIAGGAVGGAVLGGLGGMAVGAGTGLATETGRATFSLFERATNAIKNVVSGTNMKELTREDIGRLNISNEDKAKLFETRNIVEQMHKENAHFLTRSRFDDIQSSQKGLSASMI
jgi:hypothetical protein